MVFEFYICRTLRIMSPQERNTFQLIPNCQQPRFKLVWYIGVNKNRRPNGTQTLVETRCQRAPYIGPALRLLYDLPLITGSHTVIWNWDVISLSDPILHAGRSREVMFTTSSGTNGQGTGPLRTLEVQELLTSGGRF